MPLWSALCVTALWPFLFPSFGTVFLVFLLNIVSCVPLTKLFLQVMVLFCETFHYGHKGLDLPLQCDGSQRLISLNVVGSSHQASEYHATFVSEKQLAWLNSRSPQTTSTDDAVNLTSELHDPNARINHLRKRKKERT